MFSFHASSIAIVSIAFALFNLSWHSLSCYQEPDYNQEMSVAYDFLSLHFMVKIYYVNGESDCYIYGQNFVSLMVCSLLHLWLLFITFTVGKVSVTFMVHYCNYSR